MFLQHSNFIKVKQIGHSRKKIKEELIKRAYKDWLKRIYAIFTNNQFFKKFAMDLKDTLGNLIIPQQSTVKITV